MRRWSRILLLCACLWPVVVASTVGVCHGQDIGSFFVSMNYNLSRNELQNNFTTYAVDDVGFSAGFMLPIYVRKLGLHYKGRVAFHGVEDVHFGQNPSPDDDEFYRNMGQYISSLNALMVGRRFAIGSSAYVHPLLGFGVLVHVIYGNHGEGIAYGSFEFDLSAQLMYRLAGVDVGVQGSFEYVPWDGYFESADVSYVTLGAVIAK